MKIASSPTQIAAQAMAANAAPNATSLRPQVAPRRIQTADLVELTKQIPQAARVATSAAPIARETQTSPAAASAPRESQPAPTRPTRPGSLLDIKV